MAIFGVISDIHGNIWALDAVLSDAKRRGIKKFLNLGDSLYGPLDPAATADRLMGIDLTSIRGNQDRLLLAGSPNPSPTFAHSISALTLERRRWLESHPATAVFQADLFLCHGSPADDEAYLLEVPTENGSHLRKEVDIAMVVVEIRQPIILCGHSHIPRIVRLEDERLIVNPGSVGLPAYRDDHPPHKMENGSPHARYAVLSETPGGWVVEQIAVPYDWQAAAHCALQNDRRDWAASLLSGRAE